MRTRRSGTGAFASCSRNSTPDSPRDSVSPMMWAWVTGTKSSASKKRPTCNWWVIAQRRGSPTSPASIACSSSFYSNGILQPICCVSSLIDEWLLRPDDKCSDCPAKHKSRRNGEWQMPASGKIGNSTESPRGDNPRDRRPEVHEPASRSGIAWSNIHGDCPKRCNHQLHAEKSEGHRYRYHRQIVKGQY